MATAPIKCPHCFGSGSVADANPLFDPDDDDCAEDETIETACPSCTGEGTIDANACPFCASTDVFVERGDLVTGVVVCNQCGARGPLGEELPSADEAEPGGVNALLCWNRRACAGESERRIDIVLGRGEWIGATRIVDGEMPALVFARAATPNPPGTPASEAELQEAIAKEVVVIAFFGWQALLHLLEALQHLGTEIAEATGIDIEEGRT